MGCAPGVCAVCSLLAAAHIFLTPAMMQCLPGPVCNHQHIAVLCCWTRAASGPVTACTLCCPPRTSIRTLSADQHGCEHSWLCSSGTQWHALLSNHLSHTVCLRPVQPSAHPQCVYHDSSTLFTSQPASDCTSLAYAKALLPAEQQMESYSHRSLPASHSHSALQSSRGMTTTSGVSPRSLATASPPSCPAQAWCTSTLGVTSWLRLPGWRQTMRTLNSSG